MRYSISENFLLFFHVLGKTWEIFENLSHKIWSNWKERNEREKEE